jgi:hypothetical protein
MHRVILMIRIIDLTIFISQTLIEKGDGGSDFQF